MNTLDFAKRYLFTPLGIDTDEQAGFSWKTDPLGYPIGGTWLHLKARDAAKFGYLYANNGMWDGQIISAEYVHDSTREHTRGGHPEGTGYGYHWWVTEVAGHHSFYAAGYGGQYIHVFPDLDTVMVLLPLTNQPSAFTIGSSSPRYLSYLPSKMHNEITIDQAQSRRKQQRHFESSGKRNGGEGEN